MRCINCIHSNVCPKEKYATDMSPYIDFSEREDVEEMCADFKDENKFIELPCAVGDTLYDARTNVKTHVRTDVPRPFTVCSFDLVIVPWETWYVKDVHSYEFGKTVFKTKEEAEEVIKNE